MAEIDDAELKALRDAAAEATGLKSTNERLLDENSKTKTRAQDAEEKIQSAAKRKLEEEGQTNELLEQERKERSDLQARFDNQTKLALKEKIRTEVSKHAKDALDVDDLLSIKDKEVRSLLKASEEDLSVLGAEEFVTKVRELKPHFFGKKQLPDYNNKKGKGDDDKGKSEDQLYSEALKKVNTRSELAAVRKKFGKDLDSYNSNY